MKSKSSRASARVKNRWQGQAAMKANRQAKEYLIKSSSQREEEHQAVQNPTP
jgi:hypothetical protein